MFDKYFYIWRLMSVCKGVLTYQHLSVQIYNFLMQRCSKVATNCTEILVVDQPMLPNCSTTTMVVR